MLKSCIIIEDQPPAQRILQKFISDIGSLELKGAFSDALEALTFLQQNQIDLIFLDIHLPKISGIDFLKTIKNQPQVILTTAFSEYALESYEYDIVDYLLKPFSFQRFVQAVTKSNTKGEGKKLLETQKVEDIDHPFFIKSGYDLIKVKSKDILFIKSDTDYTEIVTSEKKYLSSDSLKSWLEKLNTPFCQIHKSYLINTSHLQKVSGNQVYLNNEHILPIGRAYKEHFLKQFIE